MSQKELSYFETLKEEIAMQLQQQHANVPTSVREWKGNEIVLFQEDLLEKVQGSVSEKWFYTHIKNESTKLPRIDMLNMLAAYAQYTDWQTYLNSKNTPLVAEVKNKDEKQRHTFRFGIMGIGIVVAITIYFAASHFINESNHRYQFCFVDESLQLPVNDQSLHVYLLNDHESPRRVKCDSTGCFVLKTDQSKITFVIKSPYYKTDTITRYFANKPTEEEVRLQTNDYAMMIHFFSKSKVEDWKKRRKQLDEIIDREAQIYQVFGGEYRGVELYTKREFINKLTMPLSSLKDLEIIDAEYKEGKISRLKFVQQDKDTIQ